MDCPLSRIHLTEVTDRLSLFEGSVKTMVMLVPFTTALPPQNDYSDYAPRNPDTFHECQADEAERLAAEKQEETTRKPDDEPNAEDFSKILGMLLNAATVGATPSNLNATTTPDALQGILSTGQQSADSVQSGPKSSLPEQVSTPAPVKSRTSAQTLTLNRPTEPAKLDTTELRTPVTATVVEDTEVKSEQTSGKRLIPGYDSALDNSNPLYLTLNTADLQSEGEMLPNAEFGIQQLGIETAFLSAARSYTSAKDTDAVTQEIMNALSRAVAASAPARSRPGLDGLQSSVSNPRLSEITNLAPLGTESIGSLNTLGTSINKSDESLQESGSTLTSLPAGSQGGTSDQFWVQQSGSDADRRSNQTASPDSDQLPIQVASGATTGSDGSRLSSSGAVALTLPDLATSVASEMRQPLSSQVSRSVMEYLERQTTAESETLTVQLDPPDLGEMVIELSKSKEGLSVRVTAREAVTMDMLLARGSEIENQLRGEKLDLRSLEFLSPDMMNGGAFQRQTSQDSTSRFDQPVGTPRRNSRNGAATHISTATTTRAGDSQHALNFRA